MPDETKATIRKLYEQALGDLDTAKREAARSEQYSNAARTAPEDIGRVRHELNTLEQQAGATQKTAATTPVTSTLATSTLTALEQQLVENEADLLQWQLQLQSLDEEPKRRATRRREIPQQMVTLRKQLTRLERSLSKPPAPEEPAELTTAKQTSLQANLLATQQTISAGDAELDAYQATIDLLPIQRDLAAAQVAKLQRAVETLQEAIKQKRQTEVASQRQVAEADLDTLGESSILLARAEANLLVIERRQEIRRQLEKITKRSATTSGVAASLQQQRVRIEEKVEAVGLTGAIGPLMRKQKSNLPQLSHYERAIYLRQKTLKTAQLELLQWQDRRADLGDLEIAATRIQQQATEENLSPLQAEQRESLVALLKKERSYLDFLIENSNAYVDQLIALDQAERALVDDIQSFTAFLDENVLWVRSAETLSTEDLPTAMQVAQQFYRGAIGQEAWHSLRGDGENRPFFYGSVLLLLALARLLGWQMTRRHYKAHAIEDRPTRIGRLLHDLLRVLLCAAPLPLLLGFLGLSLKSLPSPNGYSQALGSGLTSVAVSFLPLAIMIRLCRRGGFACHHFGWTRRGTDALHTMLITLAIVALPLTLIHATLNAQDNMQWQDSLGRVSFIINVLFVALLTEKFLRPYTGLLFRTVESEDHRSLLLLRLRWPSYLLGVGIHLGLAVLSVVGYTYAADRLGQEIRATALLLGSLLVVGSLLVYWSRVFKRRRSIQAWQQAREAETLAKSETPSIEAELATADRGDGWFMDSEAPDNKIRSLITTILVMVALIGCWIIWIDVFPAFQAISKYTLWHTEVAASATELATAATTGDSAGSSQNLNRVPVTLGHVLLALFVVLGTLLATRHIGGLFELPFLDQLPLDKALRNSIVTVTRYVLWIVAVVIAAGLLGVTWGKVQWMAAALSLGLGFGLQEIFANFFSGLILLFERPMRVGDVITIGDKTGVVKAIRMRATTITDWDRKDLVVPNKEFATGRLLNWTLTNKINRRVIEVGVAYGTDPDRVKELLLKIASENERVLDSPKPIALLQQFGENALIFSLRVYHERISDRLRGLHELNAAIARAFIEEGITIAFPQRDLHIHRDSLDLQDARLPSEEEPTQP